MFTIQIGRGESIRGEMETINWGEGPYFLQVELDANGGNDFKLVGSTQLLSVPYALYAENAGNSDSLWDVEGASDNIFYKYANGEVRFGTPEPTLAPFKFINQNGSIDFNQNTAIAEFTRQLGDSQSRFFIYGYPDDSSILPHLRRSTMLYATGDADKLILTATKPSGKISFMTQSWQDPNNEKVVIDNSGNVGIGITNPNRLLHLQGNRSVIQLNRNMASPAIQFGRFENDTPFTENNYLLGFGIGVDNSDNSSGGYLYFGEDVNKDFSTGNGDGGIRMAIQKGGNVGIGTINPKSKLQVTDGDIYIEDVTKGVIMKSPNGQCWRYAPNDMGELKGEAIECPN